MLRVTYRLWYWTMLSNDYRLRLTEICCRIKLGRKLSLDDRIWAMKLCEANASAAGIRERLLYRFK